ncbi:MAG: hypothetical protein ACLR49_16505 [Bacteroides stercoris]
MTKVPETLRIYEIDLPTKRVAGLADNCIESCPKRICEAQTHNCAGRW